MGVVNVKPKWSGSRASTSGDTRGLVAIWSVLLDGADTFSNAPLVAKRATGIPRAGQSHPNDPWLRAASVEASPAGGPFLFDVTVTYEVKQIGDEYGNPLDLAPKYSWSWASSTEPIDRDMHLDPIANSAEEPFDPPITREFADLVLTVQRNELGYDHSRALTFKNTVNADMFLGQAPHQARMIEVSGNPQNSGGFAYIAMSYRIQFRKDGWARRILDRGFREHYTDANGKEVTLTFRDDQDQPLAQPCFLNGAGKKLPKGVAKVWLTFDIYEQKNWAELSLA